MLNEPILGNYILSLRYNPHHNTDLPKLNWKDFFPSSENVSADFIQKILQKSIEKKIINQNDTLTMALSGGIDSTLVLSLIKETIPHQNVEACLPGCNPHLHEKPNTTEGPEQKKSEAKPMSNIASHTQNFTR